MYSIYISLYRNTITMSTINKIITVDTDDVKVIAAWALATKNLAFKTYAEKLLRDKADQLRKQKKVK